MGGGAHGHSHLLFVHGDTYVHRLRPQCKVAATLMFVLAVVATPREAFWAFAIDVVVLGAVARAARVPVWFVLRRLSVEIPFVAFAVFLPFIARGERIDLLGLSLSSNGLWAAWNILIKSTLGVAATIVMAATTPIPKLLEGLDRLRLPRVFTSIMGFMVRYADVVTGEMRRMRIARLSRGHDPRWIWQVRALASSAGALFVRSFERGERVYLSMVSRGFAGSMPVLSEQPASRTEWGVALVLPVVAATVASVAWLAR